jgi:hypothetical protein
MKHLLKLCIECNKKLDPNRSNEATKLHFECKNIWMKRRKLGFFARF